MMESFLYKIEPIENPEYRKILPMLFPNYITVFPVKLSQKTLESFFKNDKQFFSNLLPVVIKNKWSLESVQYDFNTFGLNLEITTSETSTVSPNEISDDTSDEIYSYLKRETPNFDDFRFCNGIYIAAERLGIVTGHAKLPRNTVNIFSEGSDFRAIPLKSLEIDFQLKLFEYHSNRNIVFVSGGTGIGKTSQIPKLLFWFDTLFSWDPISNEHFHTLLSLPKIQLINFFEENFNSSIDSTGFLHKYYYGSENQIKDNTRTKILVCTNKISSKRFLHLNAANRPSSVILDEIHESDIHTTINLSLIHKYKNLFGAVVLMSATPGTHLQDLTRYFDDVKLLALPNVQLHRITTHDMYNENVEPQKALENALKKYKPKKKEAAVVFCSGVAEILGMNKYLSEKFPTIKFINVYSKEVNLKENLDSISRIIDPIVILSTNLSQFLSTLQ